MMKRILLILAVCCSISASAQKASCPGMDVPYEIHYLYPSGQNVDSGIVENGVAVTQGPGDSNGIDTPEFYWLPDGSLNDVSDSARIYVCLPPAEMRKDQMIIVCPGGGYGGLTWQNEGVFAASVLTGRGYPVCVVCYRMPKGHHSVPLTDVQNAFRYCRYHASEWGVRQIGVMGFSAGGHLAASASTLYVDELTRPDFSVIVYPVISTHIDKVHTSTYKALTGGVDDSELMERYSLERQVTSDTPPAVLFHSTDDKGVSPDNSILYYQALRAAGVSCELHVFPRGGHGWSFVTMETAGRDKLGPYRAVFDAALADFLESVKQASAQK